MMKKIGMSLAMTLFIAITGYGQEILINGELAKMSDLPRYEIVNDTISIQSNESKTITFAQAELNVQQTNLYPKQKGKVKDKRRRRINNRVVPDWISV